MADWFHVQLLSPVKPLANLAATLLEVEGVEGQMGLLPGHAALLAELKPGVLKIVGRQKQDVYHYFVSSGYVQFQGDTATVLAEVIEAPGDVSAERVQAAEKRALERLSRTTDLDINIGRALAALQRARARLALLKLGK